MGKAMDQKLMKRLWADRWIEVVEAFGLFTEDQGREPATLRELVAYLQANWPDRQCLIGAVIERVRKYEPRR